MIPGREWLAIPLLAVAACSGESVGPVSGALEVTATVMGPGTDPDGFLVVVDRSIQRSLGTGDPVVLGSISAGDHELALEGIGPNCTVTGSGAQKVTVVAGDTSSVAFEVSCQAAAATLRVTVQTTGSDLDPSGYDVFVDGARAAAVDPDGATLFAIPAGPHTVTLGGVNPNCAVAEPLALTVTPSIGQLSAVEFAIQCVGASRAGPGHEIAFSSSDARTGLATLAVVNDDGSHREALFPQISYRHDTPSWALDGRLAYYAYPSDSMTVLTVADASGGVLEEFSENFPSAIPTITWAPDGSALAVAPTSVDCMVRLLQLDGSPERSLDVGCNGFDVVSLAWSPDGGRLAFVALDESETQTSAFTYVGVTDFDAPGTSAQPAGCEGHLPSEVAWSPDGSRLAVADSGIEVFDLAASTCTRLTDEPTDASPSWSPDGTRIAFSSRRDGNAEIYVMQADGSNITRLTRSPSDDFAPSWRP